MKIVIIGGGISGLASAYRVQEAARAAGVKPEITLLERDAHLGGKIRSDRHEGWVVETGPNGYLDSKPGTVRLVKDLGLEDKTLPADEASKTRLLYLDGRLQALPTSPPGFMTSSVLPLGGRLRILLEPFQKVGPEDETLAEFGRRRLGNHAVERLLDPFVTGIFAGDPERLSVAAAFPAVKKLELEHGGLIKGMRARAKERRLAAKRGEVQQSSGGAAGPGGHLTSMAGGLTQLIDGIAEAIEGDLRTGVTVEALARNGAGWKVHLVGEPGETLEADVVVLATPAPAAASLLEGVDAESAGLLRGTPYASMTVVGLGFPKDAIHHDLRGFGYLIPGREKRKILGCLWTSSIYPGHRAPKGYVLMRVMVGGARAPELAALPDDELLALVRSELELTMGMRWVPPSHQRIFRWPQAVPQYPVGHLVSMGKVLERLAGAHPGLFLTGNHLYGIGINDCTADAERIAGLFTEFVKSKGT
ncbi:MAG: protoporphyrinogen oxidase [Deltaproteobacteria bacterium]|nr:protoporphyrinogen oxidase [Deltaproteobacteria bacterium]